MERAMSAEQSEQTQLVIDGVQPPPPPAFGKPEIIKALVAHIETAKLWPDTPAEESAADIASQWHPGIDGYELAKNLDNHCGWFIDAEVVDQLDNIDMVIRAAQREARKAWAKAWNIQPPHPVGTKVKSPHAKGVIAGVCDYMGATYLIKEDGCTQEGRHLLVKFEDVTPVELEATA
jgi:hypothetical protein